MTTHFDGKGYCRTSPFKMMLSRVATIDLWLEWNSMIGPLLGALRRRRSE
jgi:hypothetical protein